MKLIAAVDKNWGIGKNNRLLVSIPEDMQLFRQETAGKAVIMGRRTFEGLKDKSPLYGRENFVLTRSSSYDAKGARVCGSVSEALEAVRDFDDGDIYVIGGGQIYEQFLPYCSEAHITKIDYVYDADTFIDNLDVSADWKITASSEEKTYFDIVYEFVKYERVLNPGREKDGLEKEN